MIMCLSLMTGATYALFTSEANVNVAVTSATVQVTATVNGFKTYSMDEEMAQGTFENGGTATLADNTLTLTNVTPGDRAQLTIALKNDSNVAVKYQILVVESGDAKLVEGLELIVKDGENALAGVVNGNKLITAWAKLDPVYGKTCMIIGAGSIGLCCLAVAKAMGMRRIVVVATSSKRLKAAKALGAYATVATREEDLFEAMKKHHPEGTDYIIEATGIEECIQNSFKLCKKGGYVALAGYGRGKNMSIRIDDIHVNNLHVVGAGNNWNQHKKAIQMMADGMVDMTPFISETLDLSEFQKGLDDARNRPEGFVKAIFTFDKE